MLARMRERGTSWRGDAKNTTRRKAPEVVHSPEEAIVDRDSCNLLHSVASAIFDMPQKFLYGGNWRFLIAGVG